MVVGLGSLIRINFNSTTDYLFGIIIKQENIPFPRQPFNHIFLLIAPCNPKQTTFSQYTSVIVCFYILQLFPFIMDGCPGIPFQIRPQRQKYTAKISNPIHTHTRSFPLVTTCTYQLSHRAHRACLFQTSIFHAFIAISVVRPAMRPISCSSTAQSHDCAVTTALSRLRCRRARNCVDAQSIMNCE